MGHGAEQIIKGGNKSAKYDTSHAPDDVTL